MMGSNQTNDLVGTAHASPLDSMPSATRAAIKRPNLVVGWLTALGIAALALAGTRAAMTTQLHTLEAQVVEAQAETTDALSDLSQLTGEVEQLRLVQQYSTDFRIPADLADAIHEAARREDLDPRMAFRLVATESSFRKRAISPVGAIGYTQIMPSTAAWLDPDVTERDLFDRDTNLRLGFRYLRMLMGRYGDARLALLAYNRGPGVVSALMIRGEDPANGYARQILGSE